MSAVSTPNPVGEQLGAVEAERQFSGETAKVRRKWTPAEDDYLREWFRKKTALEIANSLGRTEPSIKQRALKALSLPRTRMSSHGPRWTLEEDSFLTEKYGRIRTKDVAAALGRTVASIHSRALVLGLTRRTDRGPNRPWSKDDESYVLASYGMAALNELAFALRRTPTAIRNRANHPRWGLRPGVRRPRPWLPEEDNVLRAEYQRTHTEVLAGNLGRSVSSVHSRVHALGLTRHFKRSLPKAWTSAEDNHLQAHYGEIRPAQLANTLNRTRASVYHRADTLGLKAAAGSPEYLRRQSLPRTSEPFRGIPTATDVGYVAGIVDGEGSLIGPPKFALQVSMTTREVVERLRDLCGGSVTGPYEGRSGRSEVCKPQYHWTVSSADSVYRILKVLFSHLIVKRDKAEAVMQFLERKWSIESS